MKETKVVIGGRKCLSREDAERAIRQADPEEVVRLAYVGGTAVLELEHGYVLARGEVEGWETCAPTEVLLWTVSREDHWSFYWWLESEDSRGNWLDGDEVEEVLLRVREGMMSMRLDAECVPVELFGEMVSAYSVRVQDRRAEEYVRSLQDDPDPANPMPYNEDFLRLARGDLDRIYGTVPDGEVKG